jgi:uncharacterized protein with ATP-grasp and redox domains
MNQTLKVSNLLKLDDNTSKKLLDNTAQLLIEHDLDHTPPQIAKSIYRMISEITGKDDPLALEKEEATKLALSVNTAFVQTLQDAVKLALIGNVIDFGAQKQFDLNIMIQDHFHRSFGINDLNKFEHELKDAKELVYIGDNVGEHIFDKLLIEMIKKHYPDLSVYYFVRGKPVINDVTLKEAQILKDCAHIIDTGVETPGYDLSEVNTESKVIFDRADIVLAKGMGNFESLYLTAKRPVYFLFIVKCNVVAQAIGEEEQEMILKKG